MSSKTPESGPPPYAIAFYQVAVDDALRSAAWSFLTYGDVIESGGSEAQAARLLHDALTHSAAVSRFFWPPRGAGRYATERGEQLRSSYGIDESSALFDRNLRNELEHFDEKLDDWLQSNPVGPIIASPVFADHSIVDDEFGHTFKIVDTANQIFVILGRKYKFGPISREIARLLSGDDWQGDDEIDSD